MHFGHESRAITMLFLNEIIPLAIPYHSSPIPMSVQCICKILLKFVYSFLRYWPKLHFGHKSRAITLLFLNEIIPLAIPYHSSPIPMSVQSLKTIGKKVLKLEHRASIKGSLGVIYSQKPYLNFQIWMVGSEVLVIIKYIITLICLN